MNDASPIPWAGLMVAGITVVVVFGLVALLNLLATLAVTACKRWSTTVPIRW